MFSFRKNFNEWPKVSNCEEVQAFVDQMCEEYNVPPIKVMIKSSGWMDWFSGEEGIPAFAFYPKINGNVERYIAFDGSKCRISGKVRNKPIKVSSKSKAAWRVHIIIHEFIHHYFHHEGINTSNHGRTFRQMEKKMNAEYGIFFFYAWNNYAIYFHNFWGFSFGKNRPNAAGRGWE